MRPRLLYSVLHALMVNVENTELDMYVSGTYAGLSIYLSRDMNLKFRNFWRKRTQRSRHILVKSIIFFISGESKKNSSVEEL